MDLVLAAAGGGSSSFGGGSSGGGFSGGSSSGGGSGGGSLPAIVWVFILIGVAIFVVISVWQGRKLRKRQQERKAAALLAATEAAEDDEQFSPDEIQQQVHALFRHVQDRWSENDTAALEECVDEDLMKEWRLRLDDFREKGWRNVVEVGDGVRVELVALTNREGESEDRITCLISATLEDYVKDRDGDIVKRNEATSTTVQFCEMWTLRQQDDKWLLAGIETPSEGAHHYESPLVASPWSDQRVADDALVELARADAAPAGFATAEIADLDFAGDARAAALDLSLADARFGPDILEVAVKRAVEAWATAVDGSDETLEALAGTSAIDQLLYAGDGTRQTRVVLRGGRIAHVKIVALDAAAVPPTMTADVTLTAVRYVENRATAAVTTGTKDSATTLTQRWTFALAEGAELPWRLQTVA